MRGKAERIVTPIKLFCVILTGGGAATHAGGGSSFEATTVKSVVKKMKQPSQDP